MKMTSIERENVKKILKGLSIGTKIYVKDDSKVDGKSIAEFVKMNRTRFIVYWKGCRYSFSLECFKGVCGKEEIHRKFTFIEKNNNPMKHNTNDCTVRGVAELMDISWQKAMMGLAESSCVTGKMPNMEENLVHYLEKNGFRKVQTKRIKIMDFVEKVAEPHKKYAVMTKYHFTVVKGHDLIDTWDCGGETATVIYEKEI